MTILDTINSLAAEQLQLYRELQAHPDDDGATCRRLLAVQRELGALWDARQHEKAGRYESTEYLRSNGKSVIGAPVALPGWMGW